MKYQIILIKGMQHLDRFPAFSPPLPQHLVDRLAGFAGLFTKPSWANVLTLLAGVILAPGRRTVAATLRILGQEQDPNFCKLHRLLNRAVWSSHAVAQRLLLLLLDAFLPKEAPVVIGLDDTIERRWGANISARGIYRDPVRSSKGHFVKTSGLRWLSAMLLVPVPWAGRIMALPFLTILAPSKRFYDNKARAPKTLLDWARQVILQISRWLPDRNIVMVADSAFAAIEWLDAVRKHACIVSRLRLDAALYHFPAKGPRKRGRPRTKGKPLPKLATLLDDPTVSWQRMLVDVWYGNTNQILEFTTGTALWYRAGTPLPLRWILVRDPKGELEPQAFLATDTKASPKDILTWFVRRWQVEVTFQETRTHLGIETQRQWSDKAILRTTPALLGLYALVTLWTHDIAQTKGLSARGTAWYKKMTPTFSDAIAAVRHEIWHHQITLRSRADRDTMKIPKHIWNRMANALAYAA